MKLSRAFKTGDPSYFVAASTSGSASPTVLTVSKGFARARLVGLRFIDAQYSPSHDAIQADLRPLMLRLDQPYAHTFSSARERRSPGYRRRIRGGVRLERRAFGIRRTASGRFSATEVGGHLDGRLQVSNLRMLRRLD
jgi:hypothetical protein